MAANFETLDLNEAATLAKCSPAKLQAMAKARIVPSAKIGRCWVFSKELLIQWMNNKVQMRTDVSPEEVFPWAKRRSGLSKRTPRWADRKAIAAIYAECRRISKLTGIEHHVDHAIPIKGKFVSGLHVADNLQILPANENQKKHNSFDLHD